MPYLYGLLNMQDLYASRVTEVGIEEVTTAIERSVEEHNRQLDALTALFARRTTDFKTRFRSPVAARLQPLDNSGRARPIKAAGQYDVGLPLQMGGTAWGADFVTSAYMTIQDAALATAAIQDADMRWVRDHLLAALFHDGTFNFVDDLHGTLAVYGLASGDATTYNVLRGADSEATDDHLLFDATLAADTFQTIYDELMEHPENGGEVIVFIPTNQKAAVEALATFYPIDDPDIRPASSSAVLTGSLGVNVPGEVIGKIEKTWVVEWRSLPNDYIVGVTTGGERPLAMREDPIAELRGFRRVADRNDYPWFERQYIRRLGFGAWNRVGAVVVKVAASYAAPVGYTSPMG